MAANTNNNVVPSLLQPLASIFPAPIKALRAPTTLDKKYQVGQLWINTVANTSYVLTSVVANVASWTSPVAGGAGAFTTLATTGAVTVGNALTVTTGGAAITGATAVVGALTQTAGVVSIGGDAVANNISIGTGAAAKTITIGNATGATSVVINSGTGPLTLGTNATVHTTTVGSATGASATVVQSGTGNVILTAPFVEINTASPFLVSSGAGVPAGGLCVNVGDLYINTTAATAATRIYVCTVAATTWTNITCAA